MKEELTKKMHSEFSVSKETEIRHKVGCVIEFANRLNKKSKEDVVEIADIYGVTYDDVLKWSAYWKKLGLTL